MYNFLIQSYATYKGLYAWLNWPGYISGVIVQPFATVIMFSILGRFSSNPNAAQDFAIGIAAVSMLFVLANGIAQSYQYDRAWGTISFFFVTPAGRLLNFISRSVFHYPNALLAFGMGLLAGKVIVGLDFGAVNWGGFIVAVLVVAASLTAFGQLLGACSIAFQNWAGIQAVANGIAVIFTGAIIPVVIFPDFVQEIARLIPMTNGLFAIRDTFAGASFSEVSSHILREAITGMIYYVIAFASFLLFEHIVKRTGTLDRDAL
jgi:ABC-type polysaccharide/polyol phosphate export permease